MDDLLDHLIRPLADGGHGFETGIPIVRRSGADAFHELDHQPGAWWEPVLTHTHPDPRQPRKARTP
jgi:hypothetical protein